MRTQIKETAIAGTLKPPSISRTETFTEISQTKMTSIVCTPYRTVEILETADGMFAIRETAWQGSRAEVSQLWFKPYELVALHAAIDKLDLCEPGTKLARKA